VRKALEVVQKFEMVWPDKDGNDPRGQGKPPIKKINGDGLLKTM